MGRYCAPGVECINPATILILMLDIGIILGFILPNLASGLNEAYENGHLRFFRRRERVKESPVPSSRSIDHKIAEDMTHLLFMSICVLVFCMIQFHVDLPRIPKLMALSPPIAALFLVPMRQQLFDWFWDSYSRWRAR